MNTLECDIYLDVELLSFDKKSEIMRKGRIILEKRRQLPVKTDSMFIEEVKVPCGGYIQISLLAQHTTSRKILDECKRIPAGKWYSHIGTIYNNGQKAIQRIAGIGKTLEGMMPDAYQKVKLSYDLSITEDKKLTYWMGLIRRSDNITLLIFRGELFLG